MKFGDCVKKLKKVMVSWQYDETDFERLSLIMMFYGLDFTVEEIKKYMKLSLEKMKENV